MKYIIKKNKNHQYPLWMVFTRLGVVNKTKFIWDLHVESFKTWKDAIDYVIRQDERLH